ncbi:hypothetical protein D3C87_1420680 [compost metagenome]
MRRRNALANVQSEERIIANLGGTLKQTPPVIERVESHFLAIRAGFPQHMHGIQPLVLQVVEKQVHVGAGVVSGGRGHGMTMNNVAKCQESVEDCQCGGSPV